MALSPPFALHDGRDVGIDQQGGLPGAVGLVVLAGDGHDRAGRPAGALGGDVVDVSAFFASFGELKAHSSQGGSDVVIALDFNDQLVLANTEGSTLSGTDFLFA